MMHSTKSVNFHAKLLHTLQNSDISQFFHPFVAWGAGNVIFLAQGKNAMKNLEHFSTNFGTNFPLKILAKTASETLLPIFLIFQ